MSIHQETCDCRCAPSCVIIRVVQLLLYSPGLHLPAAACSVWVLIFFFYALIMARWLGLLGTAAAAGSDTYQVRRSRIHFSHKVMGVALLIIH